MGVCHGQMSPIGRLAPSPSHACKTNQVYGSKGVLHAAVEPVSTHMTMADLPQEPPLARAILTWPLPELELIDRMLLRGMALISRRRIRSLDGLEHIAPERDAFILALNHSTRQEALLVPALLFLLRRGRRIH